MPRSSNATVPGQSRKRCHLDSDATERAHKIRRTCSSSRQYRARSPSPDADRKSLDKPAHPRKRRSECVEPATLELEDHKKNKRQRIQTPPASSPVSDWVFGLPGEFEGIPKSSERDDMSKAPSLKRNRSNSSVSEVSVTSDGETNTTVSREAKNSIYKDGRYPRIMESKGSFMRDSRDGPLEEELELFKMLQTRKGALSDARTIRREHVGQLRELLRNRSELRVCIDLHPHLVPSAEYLALRYPDETVKDLAEGHNDRWLDNFVFYKKLPQPDRTLAYSWSAFTEAERRKLGLSLETKSKFVACHGTLFPFFTAEVKCGKEALDVADNANLNSMTIAQRAVVELYRRVGQVSKIHRRFLGFSMSHDDGSVRIYGHYPEVDGDKVTFHRSKGRAFAYDDKDAEEWETAAQFVRNVQTHYASLHLKRLKEAIGCLRDPLAPSANPRTPSQTASASGDDATPLTPATSNSGPTFVKPGPPQRYNSATVTQQIERQRAETKTQFEQLQRDSKEREDKLQKEAKEREDKLLAQLEQQQKDSKEREAKLLAQLEQQRSEIKEQHTQLMRMLKSKLAHVEDVEESGGQS